jgi:DNA-binding protein Fis
MTRTMSQLERAARTAMKEGMDLAQFRRLAGAVLVDQAAKKSNGNQCHAAKLIKIHRNTMHRYWNWAPEGNKKLYRWEPKGSTN